MQVPHPCVNKCQPNDKICSGCGRNEAERRDWNSYSDEKKLLIIERIKRNRNNDQTIRNTTESP